MTAPRVLVARLDSAGDVLLSGPAVRAVAASGSAVTLLVGPRGRDAAHLLPGVSDVLVWHCPWIDATPAPVDPDDVSAFVARVASAGFSAALILTSFHQSALPLALLLRQAGVPRVGAASADYPGSLLDVRHRLPDGDDLHEAERACLTAAAFGYPLPAGDDGRLAVRRPLPDMSALTGAPPYVVVHPGASVPARSWPPRRHACLVDALAAAGHRVMVTGAPDERALTGLVAASASRRSGRVVDLGGRTRLDELAGVLAGAAAVVVGNTGPAHLAAAVGAPVVSLFAPTVPPGRWAPHTPHRIVLGDLGIACRGCRARVCPVPGHPCLDLVEVSTVAAAVGRLARRPGATADRPGAAADRPRTAARRPGTAADRQRGREALEVSR